MYVPYPHHSCCRQAYDVLVLLIANYIHDGEQVTNQLARGSGKDVRVPHADHLVRTARGQDVRARTEIEGIHASLDGNSTDFPVENKKWKSKHEWIIYKPILDKLCDT